jgi:hypothetical protein
MKALCACLMLSVLLFGTVANADVFGMYDRQPADKNDRSGMTVGYQGDDFFVMGTFWISERLHVDDVTRYLGAVSVDGNWSLFDWDNQFCKNQNSRLRINFGVGVGGRATLNSTSKPTTYLVTTYAGLTQSSRDGCTRKCSELYASAPCFSWQGTSSKKKTTFSSSAWGRSGERDNLRGNLGNHSTGRNCSPHGEDMHNQGARR